MKAKAKKKKGADGGAKAANQPQEEANTEMTPKESYWLESYYSFLGLHFSV